MGSLSTGLGLTVVAALKSRGLETQISSFLDSRWLLYTQPVMSEGNTAHMDGDFRYCLERVKIVKNGVL